MKNYHVVLWTGSDWMPVTSLSQSMVGNKTTLSYILSMAERLTKGQALDRCSHFRKEYRDEKFDVHVNGKPLQKHG